jgi:hypothetical protein
MKIELAEGGQYDIKKLDCCMQEPPKCKICKTELKLSETIYELPEFMPSFPTVSSVRIPVVALLCEKCGSIELFDAILLEIIDEEGKLLDKEKSRAGGE